MLFLYNQMKKYDVEIKVCGQRLNGMDVVSANVTNQMFVPIVFVVTNPDCSRWRGDNVILHHLPGHWDTSNT